MNALSNDRDVFPLKDAAERFGFTVSTLKAEAGRGRLTLYKIGKKLYTTPPTFTRWSIDAASSKRSATLL